MDDDTIPFGSPRPPRRTAPGFDRAAYDRATRRQELDRRLSSTPVPARITLALDLGMWEPPDGCSCASVAVGAVD